MWHSNIVPTYLTSVGNKTVITKNYPHTQVIYRTYLTYIYLVYYSVPKLV